MIKVKDLNGKELKGLYRGEYGLSVKDEDGYQKYIQEQNRRKAEQSKIKSLESEIEQLKLLVSQLINNKNDTK